MLVANLSEFKAGLSKFLDNIEETKETLIIKRKTGKGSVVMSLDEYNSLIETIHLLSSKANAKHLFESIEQMKKGKTVKRPLIQPE